MKSSVFLRMFGGPMFGWFQEFGMINVRFFLSLKIVYNSKRQCLQNLQGAGPGEQKKRLKNFAIESFLRIKNSAKLKHDLIIHTMWPTPKNTKHKICCKFEGPFKPMIYYVICPKLIRVKVPYITHSALEKLEK